MDVTMKTIANWIIFTLIFLSGYFTGLKVAGNIDWSWFVVLAPIWVPFVTLFSLIGILAVLKEES
jgi:hypothetical protein